MIPLKSLSKSMPSFLLKFGYGAFRGQTTRSTATFTAIRESTSIFFPVTAFYHPSRAALQQNMFCQSPLRTENQNQKTHSGIQFLTLTFSHSYVDIMQTGRRVLWKHS